MLIYLYLQAVHCCLHGFHGVDYIDENKAAEAFDSRALNKSCVAQVMENSGSRVLVELIDSESDGKETINSLLLQELCSEAKLTPVLPEVSDSPPPPQSLCLSLLIPSIILLPSPSPSLPSCAHIHTFLYIYTVLWLIVCAGFPTCSLEPRRFQYSSQM